MAAPDRYGVMGNPIAHSLSPRIHALFAEQTRQDLVYEAILVEKGRLPEALDRFQKAGGKGVNITVPFKHDAFLAVDEKSRRAKRARAVNTIAFLEDGERFGDNTDGIGLVRDLTQNQGLELRGKRILILGAGGASWGILGPILEQNPEEVVIANRTVEKAHALAAAFADVGRTRGLGFPELAGLRFHLILNATSASLSGELPPLPEDGLLPGGWCYDLMYGAETPFMRWGMAHGAERVLDGLGMLVEQAAEAFYLWRGVRPKTGPVIEALRGSG